MKKSILTLLLLKLLSFSTEVSAQGKYNILWLSVEDLSPRFACYGDSTVSTPTIDRLAREGVVYDNAFSTYGVCAPSRHSIITGMYPTSNGAMHMRTMVRTSALSDITDPELLAIPTYEAVPLPEVKCFSEILRQHGYYTTNNDKTDYQFATPITAWDESSKKAHWKNRPEGMPFFSVFNCGYTHESQLFKQNFPKVVDRDKVEIPPFYPDTENVREAIARQYDNIVAMDDWLGNYIDQLEEDGLLEKTIIVFFSDHGDGLPRFKRWVYDTGTKIPLIIRWPGKRNAGTRNNELVSFVDFAPSMLSLAGVTIPEYMEGQAFLGEQKSVSREYVFMFRDRMDPALETIRSVRGKQFRYVRNYRPDLPYFGYIPYRDRLSMMEDLKELIKAPLVADYWQIQSQYKPLEELYDTKNDPYETQNLASDPKYFEKLKELRSVHDEWNKTHWDPGLIKETELIRKLWPPEGQQPRTIAPEIKVENDKMYLDSSTDGASIAYRFDGADHWQLYSGPVSIAGHKKVEALAIRIGWKESNKVVLEY